MNAAVRRVRPARRIAAALVVLLAVPALLATSPAPEAFESEILAVRLQPPKAERSFRVSVDVASLDAVEPVTLDVTFQGDRTEGNPPTLTLVVRTPDGEATELEQEGTDWYPEPLLLGSCDGTCSYEAEVRVGVRQPGPTWTGTVAISARAGTDAEGTMTLKVVPAG